LAALAMRVWAAIAMIETAAIKLRRVIDVS
jgi:hypothetical protein